MCRSDESWYKRWDDVLIGCESSWALSHFPRPSHRTNRWCLLQEFVSSCNTDLLLKITICCRRVTPGHQPWLSTSSASGYLNQGCVFGHVPKASLAAWTIKEILQFFNSGKCGWPYDSFQLDLTGNLYSHQPQYLQSTDNSGLVART